MSENATLVGPALELIRWLPRAGCAECCLSIIANGGEYRGCGNHSIEETA